MAIDCIELISRHVGVDWTTNTVRAMSAAAHWADPNAALPFSEKEYLSIDNLLDRPWFYRLWIWQEVQLASRERLVVVGTRTFSWDLLRTAVICLQAKLLVQGGLLLHRSDSHLNACGLCYKASAARFQHLRDLTGCSLCSDPRDRVFALLSLLSPAERELGIVPNYCNSLAEVYKDFMIRMTEGLGNLELLKTVDTVGP